MTDHGDICHGRGQIAGSEGQFSCRRTAMNTNYRRLELIQIKSTQAGQCFRSGNSNISVGEQIMSQHDRFNSATADKTRAAAEAIETTRHLDYTALSLSGWRPCDLVRGVQKVA
ncbi:hypothetical protein [Bradyrhizobium sp. NBAIM01]|uniref:hypothetical protein n=1 Tax=Bradyrhizobium sp. NBAIM01 TaxID=2793818 RepID=UPI001CD81741|nr:hypothetical protein [Bradyrhizobium sp. NBAIM01]MCA1510237.1 hypothetical protein [Bradyrhizobium sp. NBAIM01]